MLVVSAAHARLPRIVSRAWSVPRRHVFERLPYHVVEMVGTVHRSEELIAARLFFNLPYGLQAVCAWQDQALLTARLVNHAFTEHVNRFRQIIALRH